MKNLSLQMFEYNFKENNKVELLFKDEVRRVGDALGLEHNILHRHPFPGPGLGIRIPLLLPDLNN